MNSPPDHPSWIRKSFKGNKVWVPAGPDGTPLAVNGKVKIKYNLKQDYEYQVKLENLSPEEEAVPARKKGGAPQKASGKARGKSKDQPLEADLPENCIRIYTDGASSGNPGPAGIGVLLMYKDHKKEISRSIGRATNNVAELTAIKAALEHLKRTDLPVRIFTDSSYSLGLLSKGWKPKKNQDLVEEIKQLMTRFRDLNFIKVKGHAGIKENEVADYLATSAIKKG